MKPTKEKPKTALASARISTNKQIHGESLEEQVEAIKKYAQQKDIEILNNGKIDVEVFSGAKKRPVYQKHIRYIKDNPRKVGYYIIRYIDRLTRGGASEYSFMKKELADLGVELIDTYGVIQPSKNMPELEELGFQYEWSISSPSEMTETMMAIQGQKERRDILTRTIPKQIKYTQRGFHIGNYDDGYVGKKINTGDQIRYIQVPDPLRAPLIQKIFALRCENKLTDKEIVAYLNNEMGYLSKTKNRWNVEKTKIIGKRGAKKLSIKQMHRILRRFSYAGILCERWTHDKPVKAQYEGLVSIDTFNQANRGKVFIQTENNSYQVIYDYKIQSKNYTRLRHNPEFPFKCIKCPICKKSLKGSSSKGKSGKYFSAYHCARNHKRFSVKQRDLHDLIEHELSKLNYSDEYIKLLSKVITKKFDSRIADMKKNKRSVEDQIKLLKSKKEQIFERYLGTENPSMQKMLDEKLSETDKEIEVLQSKVKESHITKDHIRELLKYVRKIVEHPQKTLLDKENPVRQEKLLSLVYDGFPTYEELSSGTPQLSFVFMAEKGKSTSKTSTSSQLG